MRIMRPALGLIGDDGVTSASTMDVLRPTALLPQPCWPELYHMVSSVLVFLLEFPLNQKMKIACASKYNRSTENLNAIYKIINRRKLKKKSFCRVAQFV